MSSYQAVIKDECKVYYVVEYGSIVNGFLNPGAIKFNRYSNIKDAKKEYRELKKNYKKQTGRYYVSIQRYYSSTDTWGGQVEFWYS